MINGTGDNFYTQATVQVAQSDKRVIHPADHPVHGPIGLILKPIPQRDRCPRRRSYLPATSYMASLPSRQTSGLVVRAAMALTQQWTSCPAPHSNRGNSYRSYIGRQAQHDLDQVSSCTGLKNACDKTLGRRHRRCDFGHAKRQRCCWLLMPFSAMTAGRLSGPPPLDSQSCSKTVQAPIGPWQPRVKSSLTVKRSGKTEALLLIPCPDATPIARDFSTVVAA